MRCQPCDWNVRWIEGRKARRALAMARHRIPIPREVVRSPRRRAACSPPPPLLPSTPSFSPAIPSGAAKPPRSSARTPSAASPVLGPPPRRSTPTATISPASPSVKSPTEDKRGECRRTSETMAFISYGFQNYKIRKPCNIQIKLVTWAHLESHKMPPQVCRSPVPRSQADPHLLLHPSPLSAPDDDAGGQPRREAFPPPDQPGKKKRHTTLSDDTTTSFRVLRVMLLQPSLLLPSRLSTQTVATCLSTAPKMQTKSRSSSRTSKRSSRSCSGTETRSRRGSSPARSRTGSSCSFLLCTWELESRNWSCHQET